MSDRPRRDSFADRVGLDDRAVSSVLGYTLALVIGVTMISGLIIGVSSFVDGQEQRSVRTELEVVGQRLSGELTTADRLVVGSDASSPTVRQTVRLPERITGNDYTIELDSGGAGGDPQLVLESASTSVSVVVELHVETTVSDSSATGGDVVVEYTGGSLEISDA